MTSVSSGSNRLDSFLTTLRNKDVIVKHANPILIDLPNNGKRCLFKIDKKLKSKFANNKDKRAQKDVFEWLESSLDLDPEHANDFVFLNRTGKSIYPKARAKAISSGIKLSALKWLKGMALMQIFIDDIRKSISIRSIQQHLA
ncbi:MAG: hypothetical protein F4W90_05940 [Gammaproteobacteria bacterium]|nr:hypothetical protein [Gammaproteobacteria bacterium]